MTYRTAFVLTSALTLSTVPALADIVDVHTDVSRDMTNGCEYRARVRPTATGVIVSPELHCAERPSVRFAARRVTGSTDSAAFTESLARRAAVSVREGNSTCSYEPTFSVSENHLSAGAMQYSCRTADGRVTSRGSSVEAPVTR